MNKEELKIKQLVELRTNYFSIVMLISSGIAGLFFAKLGMYKMVFLACAGLFFEIIFIGKFLVVDDKINRILREMK